MRTAFAATHWRVNVAAYGSTGSGITFAPNVGWQRVIEALGGVVIVYRWKRAGETARIEYAHGVWLAWNETRGHLAVLPDDYGRTGFDTREELETALRADGWLECEDPHKGHGQSGR